MKSSVHLHLIAVALMIAGVVPSLAAEKPSMNEILAAKVTLETDDVSFESALVALAMKVAKDHPDFRIDILGDDLKFEGITKNQRIRGLKLKDKTVAEVLTAIVLKANPNPNARGPGDPMLQLVWAIAKDPGPSGIPAIQITTRDAATKRKQKLPKVFELNSSASVLERGRELTRPMRVVTSDPFFERPVRTPR